MFPTQHDSSQLPLIFLSKFLGLEAHLLGLPGIFGTPLGARALPLPVPVGAERVVERGPEQSWVLNTSHGTAIDALLDALHVTSKTNHPWPFLGSPTWQSQ